MSSCMMNHNKDDLSCTKALSADLAFEMDIKIKCNFPQPTREAYKRCKTLARNITWDDGSSSDKSYFM